MVLRKYEIYFECEQDIDTSGNHIDMSKFKPRKVEKN